MVKEHVPKCGLLLINSMNDFRRSILTYNVDIPSSIEEDEGILPGFSKFVVG